MKPQFSLFQSHLDLAHQYWQKVVRPGDIVIDATCGNGHDTLYLSSLALPTGSGKVYALDKQPEALKNTRSLLEKQLPQEMIKRVVFIEGCHSQFPEDVSSAKLVVYNLGYLPGGDKTKTTETSSTIRSLQLAEQLLIPGGVISLMCYPGHPEGLKEETALLQHVSGLSRFMWNCCHHRWVNRQQGPSLLILQRSLGVTQK